MKVAVVVLLFSALVVSLGEAQRGRRPGGRPGGGRRGRPEIVCADGTNADCQRNGRGNPPTCQCTDGSTPTPKSPCDDGAYPTCPGGCSDGSDPVFGDYTVKPCGDTARLDKSTCSCADGTVLPNRPPRPGRPGRG